MAGEAVTPERIAELRNKAARWTGVRFGIGDEFASELLTECLDYIDELKRQLAERPSAARERARSAYIGAFTDTLLGADERYVDLRITWHIHGGALVATAERRRDLSPKSALFRIHYAQSLDSIDHVFDAGTIGRDEGLRCMAALDAAGDEPGKGAGT